MTANADMSAAIIADQQSLQEAFPQKPFAIRHQLSGHPLMTLPALADLAAAMPRDLIEYNSGQVAISQNPDHVPSVDLDPVDIVRRIESAGAWMVLKHVETSPHYRKLLEAALLSVARARGFASLEQAGFAQIEGYIFISSPHSTTPFHLDGEDNFFIQIHGDKTFAIYDNADHDIASQDDIERSMTKHRNLIFKEGFESREIRFELAGGDGCYVPYQWPHWVKTADHYSISMAITWKTAEVRRKNDLYVFNSMLRGLGMPQQPPGHQPALDTAKLAVFRTGMALVQPLRRSMTMRRLLRRIALGKKANYYLKQT